jgi:hypothetical protein
LHFPAHQRPDTGNAWNNLIFTWSGQQGGAYSLVWNAVRLYADKGYGQGRQLDLNAWVNLGDPPPPATEGNDNNNNIDEEETTATAAALATAAKFVGSITRVNMVCSSDDYSFKSHFE